ncbi:hypothetical protein AAGG74_15315 [Bacillus mexicanus]|uniref:hypothetical protein n=1 Tax=Bacillus mexicanus TaxID=2834415 RepID=UPI003D1B15A8
MDDRTIELMAKDTLSIYNEETLSEEIIFKKGDKYFGDKIDQNITVLGLNNQQIEYSLDQNDKNYEYLGNDFDFNLTKRMK